VLEFDRDLLQALTLQESGKILNGCALGEAPVLAVHQEHIGKMSFE
jgi:hypothetical protein